MFDPILTRVEKVIEHHIKSTFHERRDDVEVSLRKSGNDIDSDGPNPDGIQVLSVCFLGRPHTSSWVGLNGCRLPTMRTRRQQSDLSSPIDLADEGPLMAGLRPSPLMRQGRTPQSVSTRQ